VLIRETAAKVIDGDTAYVVWICGEERVDGTWEGWLEFHPTNASQQMAYARGARQSGRRQTLQNLTKFYTRL